MRSNIKYQLDYGNIKLLSFYYEYQMMTMIM